MDPILTAATGHLRRMESRIEKQMLAIERLRIERSDTSDAIRRLALLRAALAEMRTQLAQLTPTPEQVSAPAWALPLTTRPERGATAEDAAA
jgi:hypothetical protein